ncbi:MAG: DUF2334 domain-containing protein [Bacteroidales bacterium]|nr:DUF2334 domain-containing protein [Bacteroidales bacterium]
MERRILHFYQQILTKYLFKRKIKAFITPINFMSSVFLCMFFIFPEVGYCDSDYKTKITIAFRYDDYSAVSDTKLEKQIIEIFSDFNIPITFGVIPNVVSSMYSDTISNEFIILKRRKINILKKASREGIVEIALHGYTHRQNLKVNIYTEFSGLDYNEQYRKIKQGKNFLENEIGSKVTTFIPPWNSYDSITLQVLNELNFQFISSDIIGQSYNNSGLMYVPFTCEVNNLKDAIMLARENLDNSALIVVMFHQDNFIEANKNKGYISITEFAEIISWISQQKDINIISIAESNNHISDLSSSRYANNLSRFQLAYRLPPFFRYKSNIIYSSQARIYKQKTVMYIYLILIPLLIALITHLVSFRMRSFIAHKKAKLIPYFLLIILIFFGAAYYFTVDFIGYMAILIMQLLVGIIFGIMVSVRRLKKRIALLH